MLLPLLVLLWLGPSQPYFMGLWERDGLPEVSAEDNGRAASDGAEVKESAVKDVSGEAGVFSPCASGWARRYLFCLRKVFLRLRSCLRDSSCFWRRCCLMASSVVGKHAAAVVGAAACGIPLLAGVGLVAAGENGCGRIGSSVLIPLAG